MMMILSHVFKWLNIQGSRVKVLMVDLKIIQEVRCIECFEILASSEIV